MKINCFKCEGESLRIKQCDMDMDGRVEACTYKLTMECISCFASHNIQVSQEHYASAMSQLRKGSDSFPKKIFISGPMSGITEFNRPAFNRAADRILSKGNIPLNPAILPDGLTEPECMDICMAMLRCADEMLMLSDWEKSAGARAEFAMGDKLGLPASFIREVKGL